MHCLHSVPRNEAVLQFPRGSPYRTVHEQWYDINWYDVYAVPIAPDRGKWAVRCKQRRSRSTWKRVNGCRQFTVDTGDVFIKMIMVTSLINDNVVKTYFSRDLNLGTNVSIECFNCCLDWNFVNHQNKIDIGHIIVGPTSSLIKFSLLTKNVIF